jgi:cell wall-associated NlpC family hydrolase
MVQQNQLLVNLLAKFTEEEIRTKIVAHAKSWVGTPYMHHSLVKGKGGGVDCAMLLVGVYAEAGIVGLDFEPRPYSPQWHLHRNEEEYLKIVVSYSHIIDEINVLPGDIVLFKIGRLFAHGGIIVNWPNIIHARNPGNVFMDNVLLNNTGKHALANVERKFFSLF